MGRAGKRRLHGAFLEGADLHEAIGLPFRPLACPDTGAFIGWKKALLLRNGEALHSVIVKLLIPEEAKRTSDTRRECRADIVIPLEVQRLNGDVIEMTPELKCVSICDKETEYRIGEAARVPDIRGGHSRIFSRSHYERGLFFFVNREEAVEYLTDGRDANGRLMSVRESVMDVLRREGEEHKRTYEDVIRRIDLLEQDLDEG